MYIKGIVSLLASKECISAATTIPSKVFLRRETNATHFGAISLYVSIRVFNLLEKIGYRLMDPIASYYSDLPMNLRFVKLSHHYCIISTDPNPQRMDDDAHL